LLSPIFSSLSPLLCFGLKAVSVGSEGMRSPEPASLSREDLHLSEDGERQGRLVDLVT
jgi:hypothetical protein